MAFVRWRGNCAQLLATLSVQGHSRQICLANLEGRYAVPDWIRMRVQDEHPAIRVDWERIDRALAAGPAGSAPLTPAQQSRLEVELQLRAWAHDPDLFPADRTALEQAAQVLTNWRASHPDRDT